MRDAVEVLSEARDRQQVDRTSDNPEKFAPPHPVSRINDLEQLGCGSLRGEYHVALRPLASKLVLKIIYGPFEDWPTRCRAGSLATSFGVLRR
jgi:hypothetical protein